MQVHPRNNQTESSPGRRHFLVQGLKFTVLGTLLLPLQKALGQGTTMLSASVRSAGLTNKMVMNLRTKVVHLPTDKIFTRYDDIKAKNQKIIDLKTWDAQVKSPLHFCKGRSGIILEMLALRKLATGINDKNLLAAFNTMAIAFSPTYKAKDGTYLNKYNFRAHELLLQTLALNASIPVTKKWEKFYAVIARMNYSKENKGSLADMPRRMDWVRSKDEFDRQAAYIIDNKSRYIKRLKDRVAENSF